jgi:hypothetical protein
MRFHNRGADERFHIRDLSHYGRVGDSRRAVRIDDTLEGILDDLEGFTARPVVRGTRVLLGLSEDPVEGVERYVLTVDGVEVSAEDPIETEGLRPGDHDVTLTGFGDGVAVSTTFVIPVIEAIDLAIANDELALDYGVDGSDTVTATAVVTNSTPDQRSVTVHVLSSPPGWGAEVSGRRSFILEGNERRDVQIAIGVRHLMALAQPAATFVVAARHNRPVGADIDVVAAVRVTVSAVADTMALAEQLADFEPRQELSVDSATLDWRAWAELERLTEKFADSGAP